MQQIQIQEQEQEQEQDIFCAKSEAGLLILFHNELELKQVVRAKTHLRLHPSDTRQCKYINQMTAKEMRGRFTPVWTEFGEIGAFAFH
jgi:hypothetical protein